MTGCFGQTMKLPVNSFVNGNLVKQTKNTSICSNAWQSMDVCLCNPTGFAWVIQATPRTKLQPWIQFKVIGGYSKDKTVVKMRFGMEVMTPTLAKRQHMSN